MKLSIVIVNYNVEHYLELCLDSVQSAIEGLDAEVIVVDNDSQDGSVTMVKKRFPEVILIINKENVGFSKANNIGVEKAQGEYICILNPDTVVGEDIFSSLYAFAKAQPKNTIGITGVRLVDGSGKFLPESKRNLPTPKVSLNKLLGNGSSYYVNQVKKEETGKVEVLVGAFMFMKRSVYEEVRGFDERYFMYGEDIDLSYTISKAGYVNYYYGEKAIIHFKGESTVKDRVYRNRFYGAMKLFYQKHLRKNGVESAMVTLGLQMARLKASAGFKGRKKNNENEKLTTYILVSTSNALKDKMSNVSRVDVTMQSNIEKVRKECCYVFDANHLSYKEIIKEIITYQDRGVTFKIIPKNGTFAIGSNDSEGRGDVLHF